nr:uncharacterized protein LOC129265026 isoform X1 [Lytechinus pictus]
MTRSRGCPTSSMAAIQWPTEDGRTESMRSDDLGVIQRDCKFYTLPSRTGRHSSGDSSTTGSDSVPKNNNSATHYGTLQPTKNKIEPTSRHSFRCSVKRKSLRLLKTLKPSPLKMSSNTKRRNLDNLGFYEIPNNSNENCCIIDTDDIDKGEVTFFSYSDDGLSYTKEEVPICSAGCKKHKIRWDLGFKDDMDRHDEEYDSGGEFSECDEEQVEEVLTDYSMKEAPVHLSTNGHLPGNHSFELMSNEDFTSSFAYCETEHLNTIRRSTIKRKPNKSTSSSTSLSSNNNRKSRFVANVNRKIASKAWPLRSLWQFLTRKKDDTYRNSLEDYGETIESAMKYIRIASHFDEASISLRLTLQIVDGASSLLREVQTDLISTALKAFFTIGDDDVDVSWVSDVPREIQRHVAVGDARVHFAVPDIRHCVACLLVSPDAATLLRRRESILLTSIAEVLECREECVVVMQTKPIKWESNTKYKTPNAVLSSPHHRSSSSPSGDLRVCSSLEWMTYIPSLYT